MILLNTTKRELEYINFNVLKNIINDDDSDSGVDDSDENDDSDINDENENDDINDENDIDMNEVINDDPTQFYRSEERSPLTPIKIDYLL